MNQETTQVDKSKSASAQLITKDMTIGDVVKKFPQVAPVLQGYGLHCVGCGVSFWETLEEGASGHGMDDETINNMIIDANKAAKENIGEIRDGKLIQITTTAITKVNEFIAKEKKKSGFLRIGILSGGCAGQSYDLGIEDTALPTDEVIECEGLKIIIDKKLLPQLTGVRIDYVDSLQGSGFKIDNPNAKNSCGCGNSFS